VSDKDVSPSKVASQAKKAFKEKRYSDALGGFYAAREGYLLDQDELRAAEMSNNLCVVMLQIDRPNEALKIVEDTPALFLEKGDEAHAAMAYGNLASALEACGNIDGAVSALQEAIDGFRRIDDQENLLYSAKALSELQLRQGKALEAVATMQTGLENQKGLGLRRRLLRRLLDIPSRLIDK
jgi:tetratricopeptide (TPR) repeat protein